MKLIENCNAIDYVLEEEDRILLHVVSNQKVMGSGIALEIKNRIPSAYKNYMYEEDHFGYLSFSDCGKVINLGAQDKFGTDKRHLNYGAFSKCLNIVKKYFELGCLDNNWAYQKRSEVEIVVPHLMGCDRAGGDWEIVLEMLDYHFKDNLTVCKL